MSKSKKAISYGMMMVMAGTLFVNTNMNPNTVNAVSKNLYANSKTYYMVKGKSITLVSSFKNKKTKWTISNKKCVKVQKKTSAKLKLKAKKTGTVRITLKCGKQKRKCTLRILPKTASNSAAAATSQTYIDNTASSTAGSQTAPQATQTVLVPQNTEVPVSGATQNESANSSATTESIPGANIFATTQVNGITTGTAVSSTTQGSLVTNPTTTMDVTVTTAGVAGQPTTQGSPVTNPATTMDATVTTAGAAEQPTTQGSAVTNPTTTMDAAVTTAGAAEQPTTQGSAVTNPTTTMDAAVTTAGAAEQPTTQESPVTNPTTTMDSTVTTTVAAEQPTTQGSPVVNPATTTQRQPATQDDSTTNASASTAVSGTTETANQNVTTQALTQTTQVPATTQATTVTTESSTTQSGTQATTEDDFSVEEAGPVTAEDLANREASQADIPSSFTFPTYTGDGTFYGGGYTGGCCNLDSMTNGYYICALNKPDYNNSQMAGAFLKVTGPTGTLKVLVADELPEGKKGDIDFNEIAFPHVANVEDGRVPVSWTIVPFPTEEPIKYWIKKDSTSYWMQLQVRNQRYPIEKVEMLQPNGTFAELNKENYNFYTIYMPGDGPYVFRVTDINGQVLTDTIEMQPGKLIDGKANFPY